MAPQTTELPGTASFPSRIRRPRKTCVQCAKGKRKCDKTSPSCLRCRDRGIRCVYPPRFNLSEFEESVSVVATIEEAHGEATPSNAAPRATSLATAPGPRAAPAGTDTTTPSSRWFLSPGTWIRQHGWTAPQYQLPVSEKSLPHFIDKLKGWVHNWVRDGHSPIMHRQMYAQYTPECIEDAYTSLAAYHVASPTAKATALRVIESRVNKLLTQTPDEVDGICSALLLDTATHLARTQGLFMYQLIRLFDGDIRARAQAEGHIEMLHRWSTQLLESAQLDCAAAEVFHATTGDLTTETSTPMPAGDNTNSTFAQINLNPSSLNTELFPNYTATTASTTIPATTNLNPFVLSPAPSPPALHKTWLLSESIRRIYIASIFMQSVYKTLKQGWAVCPGGIAFTAQSGLWDASSPYEWVSILRDGATRQGSLGDSDGGGSGERENETGLSPWVMLQGLEAWRILEGAVPREVDEFAVTVAEISCGVERVEQWVFEKGR